MATRILAGLRGNLVGMLALVLVLGGTAYAAATIGADDLKDFEIIQKDKQLKAKQLKSFQAHCNPGTRYISGGYEVFNPNGRKVRGYRISEAGPNIQYLVGTPVKATGYRVTVKNTRKKGPGKRGIGVMVSALCLEK